MKTNIQSKIDKAVRKVIKKIEKELGMNYLRGKSTNTLDKKGWNRIKNQVYKVKIQS